MFWSRGVGSAPVGSWRWSRYPGQQWSHGVNYRLSEWSQGSGSAPVGSWRWHRFIDGVEDRLYFIFYFYILYKKERRYISYIYRVGE